MKTENTQKPPGASCSGRPLFFTVFFPSSCYNRPVEELTVRQRVIEALKGRFLTAKEISQAVSVKEKEVADHLAHIALTLGGDESAFSLVTEPSECLECGFVFRKRERLKTPSKCPVCRSEEITETRFGVKQR